MYLITLKKSCSYYNNNWIRMPALPLLQIILTLIGMYLLYIKTTFIQFYYNYIYLPTFYNLQFTN